MNFRNASFTVVLACFLAAAAQAKGPSKPKKNVAGEFDYYMLSLSWSPDYCATKNDKDQCKAGRKLGFVLHGLWPQYLKGFPKDCTDEQLSDQSRATYQEIYPSKALIAHEWTKHGTCSGLSQTDYFDLSSKLKNEAQIPTAYQQPASPVTLTYAGFQQALQGANPSWPENSALPFCRNNGKFLSEARLCYDKSGSSPVTCSAEQIKQSTKSCAQDTFLLLSVK